MKIRLGSLFSGIGGFELGFEMTGAFETVFQVENNPDAQQILKKHWPLVQRFDDVRTVGKHNLPACDILIGGFPCQPHSISGKRKASEDERDLWGEFARIISECKPRVVVCENVTGLLTSENGAFFTRVLNDLDECGFDVEWETLSARDFGAPHERKRIFIVAYPHSINGEKWVGDIPVRTQTLQPQNRSERVSYWEANSRTVRVDDGIPQGLDASKRIKALGNAVVPQVAFYVAQRVIYSGLLDAVSK